MAGTLAPCADLSLAKRSERRQRTADDERRAGDIGPLDADCHEHGDAPEGGMMRVVVDSREQKPLDFAPYPDISTEVMAIRTGDYSLAGMQELVAVERAGEVLRVR